MFPGAWYCEWTVSTFGWFSFWLWSSVFLPPATLHNPLSLTNILIVFHHYLNIWCIVWWAGLLEPDYSCLSKISVRSRNEWLVSSNWFLFFDYFFNIFISTGSCSACIMYYTSKIKKPFYQTTRLIIKKKQADDNDPQHIWVLYFQPNLTNGTLKERQGDPPYLRRAEHGTRIL